MYRSILPTFGILSIVTACATSPKVSDPNDFSVIDNEVVSESETDQTEDAALIDKENQVLSTRLNESSGVSRDNTGRADEGSASSSVVGKTDGEIHSAQDQVKIDFESLRIPTESGLNGLSAKGSFGSRGRISSSKKGGQRVRIKKRPVPRVGYMPPASLPQFEPSQSNTEQYTDHGVNPFTLTAKDNKSTFSVDVDTASYTISRRKLNAGQIPPMASVRAEEFINHFDYQYDARDANPFSVDMAAMPDPFRPDRHILRVGVQGKEVTAQTRPPLRLTFLIDVSGSMSSQDKLPLAKKGMHMLVETLNEGDSVAIATYAGGIRKVLEPTYGDNKRQIHAAIDSLQSGGSTAMSSGLDLAYSMAWETFKPGAENRVIVMSDGDANVGRTSWTDMLNQIKGYADRGVTMSTIGFGMGNYKDTRMEQLANKGDGNNYYVDSLEQASRLFVKDFNGTMISIARDVKLQVEFNSDAVESYRLIGYENRNIADKDFRNDRVDAGEVGAGHNVTALYELILNDGWNGEKELAVLRLRHEAPGADKSATEQEWVFESREMLNSSYAAPDNLKIAYAAGTFAEILRRSPHASEISLEDLKRYTKSAKRWGQKDDSELLSLMEKARKLGAGIPVAKR